MSVTIKKIAELAGVSRGTVDRALNARKGVNKEVADRIVLIANELGYKPNIVARALAEKRNRDKKIGIILNADDNPFYKDVIDGVNAKAKEIKDFGFEILLKTTKGYDVEQQLKLIENTIEDKINGLIISPINEKQIADKLNSLKSYNIPVVTVNTDIENVDKLTYIGSNYYQAGEVAASFFGLLSNGENQDIGIVTGSRMVLGHNLRLQGFSDCIKKDYNNLSIVAIEENNDNDVTSYIVTTKMLEKNLNIKGLFFCAAGIEGGIKAVKDLNLLNRLKIVTVDLIDVVKQNLLKGDIVATICQEPFRQGYESVSVMFEYLLGNKLPENNVINTETQIKLKYHIDYT